MSTQTTSHVAFRPVLACAVVPVLERLEGRRLLSGNWSDPAAWPDGTVPVAGEDVVVPAGHTITLDTNTPALNSLTINGVLQASDTKNLSITSDWVGVTDGGTLRVGTAADPFDYKFTLTLTNGDPNENVVVGHHGFGSKFLGVAGGTLDLHGASASKTSWTQLNGSVSAGASSITVADTSTGWQVGDVIVIAPSGFEAYEAERRTITAINGGTITLNAPLAYAHYGNIDTIQGKQVDMRAEVGLLSRNIMIQGDNNSYRSGLNDSTAYIAGFGGHTMIHHESTVRVQGVEFKHMGQTGKQGRYSLHWHFAGDSTGSYAKHNSIHDSFMRGIVTHQTGGVIVEDNVAYRVNNHIFIPSEDGTLNETGNEYINNLGILAIRPDVADFAFPSNDVGESNQDEERASGFWMGMPNVILRGNHIAGVTRGSGYFYDGLRSVDRSAVAVDFQDNVAHAIEGGLDSNIPNYPPNTLGHGLFVDLDDSDVTALFKNFVGYKSTTSGMWLERTAQVADGAVLIDNAQGIVTPGGVTVTNSLIAGKSANTIGGDPATLNDTQGNRGGILTTVNQGSNFKIHVSNSQFVNTYDGGIIIGDDRGIIDGSATGMTVVGVVPIKWQYISNGSHFRDLDGSLSGAGAATNIYPMATTATKNSNWAFLTPSNAYAATTTGAYPGLGLRIGDYAAYDDLEGQIGDRTSGIDSGFGWSSGWTLSHSRNYSIRKDGGSVDTGGNPSDADSGRWALSLDNGYTAIRNANLAGLSSVTLSFYVRSGNASGSDNLQVKVYSGSSWSTVKTLSGSISGWVKHTISIPSGALKAGFRLQFASSGAKYNVDQVMLAKGSSTLSGSSTSTTSMLGTSSTFENEDEEPLFTSTSDRQAFVG
jgi:hypothetical protein